MMSRTFGYSLALLALATAAPAADAQTGPRWQVEASLDGASPGDLTSIQLEGNGADHITQHGGVGFSFTGSRLSPLTGLLSLRYGLSLGDKGYEERNVYRSSSGAMVTQVRHTNLVYLGAPLTAGINLAATRRGLQPFAEAGVVPELLIWQEDESMFEYDLRPTGLSYLFNFGLKYNLEGGRALIVAPEARFSAGSYSQPRRENADFYDFRPTVVGIKLAYQF